VGVWGGLMRLHDDVKQWLF